MADHPLSKEYRLRQILRYLESKYVTPYPVELSFTRGPLKHEKGATFRYGRTIQIVVNLKLDMYNALECLVHEFAHAMTWRHERVERATRGHHLDEWGLAYARLYTDMYERDEFDETCGADRSKAF